MRVISPVNDAKFTITVSTEPPVIDFQTDGVGPHIWDWKLRWRTFHREGKVTTPDNRWSAASLLRDLGGTLTVQVRAAAAGPVQPPRSAVVSGVHDKTAGTTHPTVMHVKIIGSNPSRSDVDAYLAAKPGRDGFGAILAHETRDRHFTALGEPVVSFDGGHGICQLTAPAPTFEQCWSWKRNIDAGLLLFAEKRRAAIAYLSQQGRSYTPDQLKHETVARWNGGPYHTWDGKAWVRNPDILCDPATANIGWDTTRTVNQKMSVDQLHARDRSGFRRGHQGGDNWRYSGVCYADAILG